MFVLVLAAEADETRQAITFLIVCLVGVAVLLAALTVWYWIVTSPRRRADQSMDGPGHVEDPLVGSRPESRREAALVGVGAEPRGAAAVVESVDQPLMWPEPAILSESSELMSSTLAGSDQDSPVAPVPTAPPIVSVSAAPPVGPPARRIEVAERRSNSVPPDRPAAPVARPAAVAGPDPGPSSVAGDRPVAVTLRMGLGDERARVRDRATRKVRSAPGPDGSRHAVGRQDAMVAARRVARPARKPVSNSRPGGAAADGAAAARPKEALSDEDWATIMKSAFEQLNR